MAKLSDCLVIKMIHLHTANIPAPYGYNAFVNKNGKVYFNIQWDSAFVVMYRIEMYTLEASNEFIECPQMCSIDESLCRCSGLSAGSDGSITITATSCGNLQGPPTIINITPRGNVLAYIFNVKRHPQAPLSVFHLQEKNERGPGIQNHVMNISTMS